MRRVIPFVLLSLLATLLLSCASRRGETLTAGTAVSLTAAPMQTPGAGASPVEIANTLLQQLVAGQWEAATERFSPQVKQALPANKVQEVWVTLQAQVGPYQRVIGTRTVSQGGNEAAILTLQFEKAALDMAVSVDPKTGQIVGLFFTPAQSGTPQPTVAYSAPSYVNQSRFQERDVTVGSGEWALPGTLTMPTGQGPFPAVVLVHGSGPNDRDETIGPNKPFRDLAWGLASQGIAVLRYDKRTLVHAAKLNAAATTFTVNEETVDDALSAVALLRQTQSINPSKVYVLGHSLGGTMAPRIGTRDQSLGGLVILAGATRPLEDLILEQVQYLANLDGSVSDQERQNLDALTQQIARVKEIQATGDKNAEPVLGAPASYWIDLKDYRPAQVAATLNMPMLILQGERDYQVTMVDLQGWKDALSGRNNVQIKSYPALNHLFIAGEGKPNPAEYEQVGHVAEQVIRDIAAFIQAR